MRRFSLACCRTIAILTTVLVIAPVADSRGGTEVIGYLKWEVQETATARILARGEGPVHLRDVVITNLRSQMGRLTPKYIRLNDHFVLHLAEYPVRTKAEVTGFGIVGHHSDFPSDFSWEWFVVVNPSYAVKLQEEGVLGLGNCPYRFQHRHLVAYLSQSGFARHNRLANQYRKGIENHVALGDRWKGCTELVRRRDTENITPTSDACRGPSGTEHRPDKTHLPAADCIG
jgi:hypothetical protein